MQQQTEFPGPTVPRETGGSESGQNPLERYFANLPAQQLIGELKRRAVNNWTALNNRGLPTLWRLAYAQAYGMDPATGVNATQRMQFCGPQAQYIRFRIQLTRPHVKQRNNLTIGQRPSFRCVAANSSASALAQVPIAGKVLTHVFRESKGEQALYRALESDGYFGEGFVWCRWDESEGSLEPFEKEVPANDEFTGQPLFAPDGTRMTKVQRGEKPTGMPTYQALYPWNISRDPNTIRSNWIETREKVSKSELMARYPELADKISALSLDRSTEPGCLELFQWDLVSATDDVVIVKHFYHRAGPDVPGGRYMGYVGDLVLWDRACPVQKGLPILRMCSAEYFDTPFGYPETADLLSVQQAIDEIWSQGITNLMKFGNQNLWAQDGVEFDPVKFSQGGQFFTLPTAAEPPQVIDWAELPAAFQYMDEKLPAYLGVVSGMNSTMMGEPENNIDSGVFASLMQSTAEKFVSASQAAFDFLVTDTGNLTLELVRSNTDTRFAAKIAGDANVAYMQYFTQEDLAGIHSVEVERQSPVLNSIGGRFEVFDKTSTLPKADRQAAVTLLTTGDATSWCEADLSCIILIKRENERLCRGEQVEAIASDDPILHCLEHKASLDRLRTQDPPMPPQMPNEPPSQEFMQWDAAIQAHKMHIQMHSVVWMQTDPVFAAACSIPMPPMPGPMGGGVPVERGRPQSAPPVGPQGEQGPDKPGQTEAAPAPDPGMPEDENQKGPQEKGKAKP